MSWVAAGTAAVGLAGSFMGGGGGSAPPPLPSQTTGNKTITFGTKIEPEVVAIVVGGVVVLGVFGVWAYSRRKS